MKDREREMTKSLFYTGIEHFDFVLIVYLRETDIITLPTPLQRNIHKNNHSSADKANHLWAVKIM